MLRQAARIGRLLASVEQHAKSITSSASRLDEFATPSGPKEFSEAWVKKAPSTMNVPELPSGFLQATADGESKVSGDLFPVNFYTPSGVLSDMQQVDANIKTCPP